MPALEARPDITGDEWLWEAFLDLTTCRQMGMSPGPIPWSAIQQWAEVHGLGEHNTWMVHHVIRMMDAAFLEYHDKQHKKQMQQHAPPPKKR